VAIKVLPEHLTESPDALARFEREAKAVAALNHPNILGLFDVGIHEHHSYAVMELLEGESLRERLAHGPMPARKATELAIQMAQGLAAAHGRGIVHRDLKPDNLWITKDGRLKILDFGLAKQAAPMGAGSNSFLPTEAVQVGHAHHTDRGLILGTIGYMSPEQVRGETVGPRSDLFSFGTVFFEMLTGKRAFERETTSDTLAAILRDEPPEIENVSGHVISLGLRRILDHCLEKESEHRFHDAQDLAFALESASTTSSDSRASFTAPFAPPNRRATRAWGGLVALALLLALGAGWLLRGGAPPLPSFRQLTFGRGAIDGGRFVPGSRDIVYSARWQGNLSKLFMLREGSLEARALESEGAFLLGVSSQGSAAVLTKPNLWHGTLEGTLSVQSLAGGGARAVVTDCFAAEFAEDGQALCVVTPGPAASYLFQWPPGETAYASKHMLRNPRIRGGLAAFFEESDLSFSDGELLVLAKGGQPRKVTFCKGFTALAWGPGGKEIWVSTYDGSESRLLAVALSGRNRVLLRHAGRLELLDVDPAGRCLVTVNNQQRQTFGRAPGAQRDRDLTWLDAQAPMSLSADGTQVLMARYGDWQMTDRKNLYLVPTGGGPGIPLGSGKTDAALSQDGRWAATFELNTKGEKGIRLLPTGAGASRWLPLGRELSVADSLWFHPDGSKIYLSDFVRSNFARLDLDSGAVHLEAVSPKITTYSRQEVQSPDGRQFLVQSLDQPIHPERRGEALVIVREGDTQGTPTKGNLHGEAIAGWAEDSREAYLWNRNTVPAEVIRWNPATGQRRTILQINPTDTAGVMGMEILKITPDGKAYAYGLVRKLSDLYLVEGLK
jgi:hypothetical protein